MLSYYYCTLMFILNMPKWEKFPWASDTGQRCVMRGVARLALSGASPRPLPLLLSATVPVVASVPGHSW